MSRPAVFKGVLRKPRLLLDLASQMASVSRTTHLYIDRDTVRLQANHREYEVWVRLNNESVFQTSELEQPIQVEISAESLHKALLSDNGGRTVNLVVEQKGRDTMMITVKINASNAAELSVRQRIYAHPLDSAHQACQEPQIDDSRTVYCKLRRSQLEHVARISEHYKQFTAHIQIELKCKTVATELTLTAVQPGLETNTSMDVTPVSIAHSQTDEIASQGPANVLATIPLRDWCAMLQVRKLVNDIIVGVTDEQIVTVYATIDGVPDDTMTFYSYQVAV